MSSILVDFYSIVSKESDLYKKVIIDKKFKNGEIGLLLLIPKNIFLKLENLEKGKKRVDFINSKEFSDSIISFTFSEYNKGKNLCTLHINNNNNIKDFIKTLENNFSESTLLMASVDKKNLNCIDILVASGFHNPYSIKDEIVLSKKCKSNSSNIEMVKNKIIHLTENTDKETCNMYTQLSHKAVKQLKKTSKQGHTKNKNGTTSQKELTGKLLLKNAIRKNGKIIYIIDVEDGSIQSGDEEDVVVHPNRYNFHSHPEEAYIRHSVTKAWPSVTDYLGYLKLGKSTIFHCVASLEGIYIMSFSKEWSSQLSKINNSFIEKNFNINHKKYFSPEEYVKHINSILYKGYPIFKIWYFPWNKATTPFKVDFSKIKDACLVNQESLDIHKKYF